MPSTLFSSPLSVCQSPGCGSSGLCRTLSTAFRGGHFAGCSVASKGSRTNSPWHPHSPPVFDFTTTKILRQGPRRVPKLTPKTASRTNLQPANRTPLFATFRLRSGPLSLARRVQSRQSTPCTLHPGFTLPRSSCWAKEPVDTIQVDASAEVLARSSEIKTASQNRTPLSGQPSYLTHPFCLDLGGPVFSNSLKDADPLLSSQTSPLRSNALRLRTTNHHEVEIPRTPRGG